MRIAELGDVIETETEEQPNECGGGNASGEQPLKDSGALSSIRRRQA